MISWCNGAWGSAQQLMLPLSDRGLQLADGLFETVLVQGGRPRLLDAHLQRWQASAAQLGMAAPPKAEWLKGLIAEAVARSGIGSGCGALRLNWSRGDGPERGIDLPQSDPSADSHRFWLSLHPHTPRFSAVTAWISRYERRNACSLLSRCKSFAYGQAIQARREARQQGADEAVLLSTSGELCCGSTANLLVKRRGTWWTPPLSSGCLPGVMRGRALAMGLAGEQRLDPQPDPNDSWLLINSLSCRPLRSVDGQPLNTQVEACALWTRLLDPGDQG